MSFTDFGNGNFAHRYLAACIFEASQVLAKSLKGFFVRNFGGFAKINA